MDRVEIKNFVLRRLDRIKVEVQDELTWLNVSRFDSFKEYFNVISRYVGSDLLVSNSVSLSNSDMLIYDDIIFNILNENFRDEILDHYVANGGYVGNP